MKENQKSINRWIDTHDQSDRLNQIMYCFSHRGIATGEQVEIMTGLGQHPVRDALKTLTEPPGGLAPALRTINVTMSGQRGRPYAAFVLTEDGAAMLDENPRKAPKLDDPVEAAHALMEMQVFIAAYQQGRKTELEKVLSFNGSRNIRADVLLENTILFEMEQQARLNDVPRISDKLERLCLFFNSQAGSEIDHKVRILFALAANDGKTISVWQQVLGALKKKNSSIPFELYWKEIGAFMQNPEWESVNSFQLLEPVAIFQPELQSAKESSTDQVAAVPNFAQRMPADMSELNMVMGIMESEIGKLEAEVKENRYQFFQMMELIYDGSHYKGGPVEIESAYPSTSIMLLYRFLHMHQNKPLLEQLQAGYKKVVFSQRQALPFFRDNMTRFYWDVFLRYFNFGRGGSLKVKVEVPSFGDSRSEIYPVVIITDWEMLRGEEGYVSSGEPAHAENALTWVLEGMHLYAFDLGLICDKRGR
ncbi:MAG: hypothetical protein CVU42_00085 [Chloroflexi bacterium HGW-Chloroflexi-4]|jgi:hypothetical protein|nr:MAG: hypothetical protein CVU42_00085 [Chloroflexi bacterium HGW-Chloroflexi-4]